MRRRLLYTGIATDVQRRLLEHNGVTVKGAASKAEGARYTAARRPGALVYEAAFATRSEASKEEARIKRLTRPEKHAMIVSRTAPAQIERNLIMIATDERFDVIVIGAGAAGLMCALTAGQRGRKVLLLEYTDKVGAKILISGGGRCNFTNLDCVPARFISANPHFATSALKRYTPHDFIGLVERHGIAFHEKTLGQLFCDGSAAQSSTCWSLNARPAASISAPATR